MEENRELENTPTKTQSSFDKNAKKKFNGGRVIFSTNAVGWISIGKNKQTNKTTHSRFYTLHRN